MTAFDDRKTAAEAKFTHDQEFQFETIARRNKLLGLWAAEQMGISGRMPRPGQLSVRSRREGPRPRDRLIRRGRRWSRDPMGHY